MTLLDITVLATQATGRKSLSRPVGSAPMSDPPWHDPGMSTIESTETWTISDWDSRHSPPPVDGKSELAPGDVLYLGKLRMMAVSQPMLDRAKPLEPNITASKPIAFFRHAKELMGTVEAVAERFDIPLPVAERRRTFRQR